MILVNNGEYMGEGTPADVINEICERSRIGLVSALAERIDFGKEYILSFKEDTYERVTEQGNLMHGIKMMVSADTLVRCKECRWLDKGENESCHWSMCARHIGQYINVSDDDYCSYGERKDDE